MTDEKVYLALQKCIEILEAKSYEVTNFPGSYALRCAKEARSGFTQFRTITYDSSVPDVLLYGYHGNLQEVIEKLFFVQGVCFGLEYISVEELKIQSRGMKNE